jgi:beta-lactamase class A
MRALRTFVAAVGLTAQAALPRPSPAGPVDAATRGRLDVIIRQSGAEVGIAFRTLDGGDELFVSDTESFHAASTMKLPVMVELFRQADAGLLGLDQPVQITNAFLSLADGSRYSLTPESDSETDLYKAVGETRSYRELCELMITASSNLATNLLIERLGVDRIRATTAALGADGMNVRRGVEDDAAYRAGLNNTTTARALLVLLEALARGKAVSPAASAQMVAVLERQTLNESIPAGLAPGTRVAHKTGSITRIQHDAAIVYGPRPYVLVVLVRGLEDEQAGNALIAAITRVLDGAVRR